jgi:hypothetical protein
MAGTRPSHDAERARIRRYIVGVEMVERALMVRRRFFSAASNHEVRVVRPSRLDQEALVTQAQDKVFETRATALLSG